MKIICFRILTLAVTSIAFAACVSAPPTKPKTEKKQKLETVNHDGVVTYTFR